MGMNIGYLTAGRDAASDECITPRYGVIPIIKHLKARGYKTVWCPFDEDHSWYVRLLQQHGFTVLFSHKRTGDDFFDYEPPHYDVIVSNPPYSIKDKILKRLYDLKKPFAVLLPQNSLQSQERVKLYIKHGGIEYLGFDRRICFYTNGNLTQWADGNHFATGYFCKDVLPQSLMFEILYPIQEPYFFSLEEMM